MKRRRSRSAAVTKKPTNQEGKKTGTRTPWQGAEQEQRHGIGNQTAKNTELGEGECRRETHLDSGVAEQNAGERREWR